MSPVILAALLACREPSRLAHLAASVEAYDRGRHLLEAGRPGAAEAAFAEAARWDPHAPELWLWRGTALAQAGDPAGAVAAASEALRIQPGWGPALYDRACWKAALGDLPGAAEDLGRALASGEVGRFAAAADPDLEPLRAHPAWRDRVPRPELPLVLSGPDGPVFVREPLVLEISATHPAGEPPHLEPVGESRQPLAHRSTVEDVTASAHEAVTRWTVTFRALGVGEGSLPGVRVRTGELVGTAGPLAWRVLGPPGTPPAPLLDLARAVRRPEDVLGDLPLPGIERRGDRVRVRALPGDQVDWGGRPEALTRWEQRRRGQPVWVGWVARGAPGPVRVLRGEREVAREP